MIVRHCTPILIENVARGRIHLYVRVLLLLLHRTPACVANKRDFIRRFSRSTYIQWAIHSPLTDDCKATALQWDNYRLNLFAGQTLVRMNPLNFPDVGIRVAPRLRPLLNWTSQA